MKVARDDTTLLKYVKWQIDVMGANKGNGSCMCSAIERVSYAFHATLKTRAENLPRNAVLKFDNVLTNEGNAYDPVTGIFTCPENGVYSFSWTILTKAEAYFLSEIMVDGTPFVLSHTDATQLKNYLSGSQCAVLKLKIGQKVWIRTYSDGGKYAHEDWSTFSGFKV